MKRCQWAEHSSLEAAYHDTEWGVPSFDDNHLFEMLILEGAQAGLSWTTILKKRATYRAAYAGFDPARVARFDKRKQTRLLADPGIVRNRLKVAASIDNARAFVDIQSEYGSFADFIWAFVDGRPIQSSWRSLAQIPAQTGLSCEISKALKRRRFRFVGPTIIYAFMQAVGMVNDHETGCFRYRALARKRV